MKLYLVCMPSNFKRFRDGYQDLDDDPSTAQNLATAATAHELVSKQQSNDLKIDEGSSAHQQTDNSSHFFIMIWERRRCVYCLFHTDEQQDHRVTTCKDIIQICQTNLYFPSGFTVAVEFQVFHYRPERKCHGMM